MKKFQCVVLLENRYAIMHILIIIHVQQNGTRWLPLITVTEEISSPNHCDTKPYLALLDIPLFLSKLSASQDLTGLRHMKKSSQMVAYKLRQYALCHQKHSVMFSGLNQEQNEDFSVKNHQLNADLHSSRADYMCKDFHLLTG